jgi:hypothetical protein
VALVIAVFVLTVIGALVAAAFFASIQEYRMSDATRRRLRVMAAAEAQLAEVLRQWPDDGGKMLVYPRDSLVLAQGTVILRRVATDLYLVAAAENTLGLLVFLPPPWLPPGVDGVEMTQPNCHIDTTLQKTAEPVALRSRAWVHLF